MRVIAHLLAGLGAACLFNVVACAQDRLALVIGNSAYPPEVGALENPHQDARAIANALRDVGFELVGGDVVLDADAVRMRAAVFEFQQALSAAGPDAIGFLYYSGHGGSNEVNGRRSNYLIPSDAPVTGAQDLPLMGVSLGAVIDALASTGARAVFIVSDACRNTLPFTSSRGGAEPDRGFVAVGANAGVYIAHATADGQTAPDDGAFAAALAEKIVTPGLTADRVFTLAFREVAQRRTGYRRPVAQDGLNEDICFLSCPDEPSIDKDIIEVALFEASETCTDFQSYLRRYPDGNFVEIAERRAMALCANLDEEPAVDAEEQVASLTRFLEELDRRIRGPDFGTLDALYEVESAYGFDALVDAADGGDAIAAGIVHRAYSNGVFVERDDAQAIRYAQRSCDGGWSVACTSLGFMYEEGIGVAQDHAEATRLFRQACDDGDMTSCHNLGIMYANGRHVAQDDAEAVRFYRMACDGGTMAGCTRLGYMYANDRGVAQDDAEAVRLYRLACNGDNMEGCYQLGLMRARGRGGARNDPEAVRLYQLACDGDYMGGCSNLGFMYANGLGVPQDDVEAVRLDQHACDGGDMIGCSNLGLMRKNGRGGAQDDAEAVRLFRQACDGDYMAGCSNLALMYYNGRGVARDYSEAARLHELACDAGMPESCGDLGLMHKEGNGVAQDDAEAVRLYRLACNGGDDHSCGLLGNMYEQGLGVAQDYVEAVRLLRSACSAGDTGTCYNLGNRYSRGQGTDQDYVEAVRLYRIACDDDLPAACINLGLRYRAGQGVEQDDAQAAELFRSTCDERVPRGCSLLAGLLRTGRGVEQDVQEAARLSRAACESGDPVGCGTAAWLLSTSPNEGLRDGEQAVRYALFAVRALPESAGRLDTLAAAYAENREFDQAVQTQESAIDHLSPDASSERRQGYLDRLELYRQQRPYRDD